MIVDELENSELTYEKKHEFNIGAEAGFLSNRINIEADCYKRNNYDLIGPINTIGVGGIITKYANVASMRSHGFELTLSTKNVKTKDLNWTTNFIFSKAKNTVSEPYSGNSWLYATLWLSSFVFLFIISSNPLSHYG